MTTRNDENEQGRDVAESGGGGNNGAPEPPTRWNPQDEGAERRPSHDEAQVERPSAMAAVGSLSFPLNGDEVAQFKSARSYLMASQVIALVSLFFGGMLLSAIAVVCGVVAYGKLDKIAANRPADPKLQKAIRRSGRLVVALAVGALALNAIAMAFLYPLVVETLQTGGFESLLNAGPATSGSGNATWG